MANKKTATPTTNKTGQAKPASKDMEKIAVRQDIPIEDLLNNFLRQQIAPDSSDKDNYYIGQVVKIKDINPGSFDIFTDSISNLERFFLDNKTQDKTVSKQILVHIPNLYSTNIIPTGDDFLNEYCKFKINYTGNDSINLNDYVKIVFKNNTSYTDPEIVSIHRSNGNSNIEYSVRSVIQSFNENVACRIAQLTGSEPLPVDSSTSFTGVPSAGYYQLFKELETTFSKNSLENYVKSQGPFTAESFNDIKNIRYEIFAYDEVVGIANSFSGIKNSVKNAKSDSNIDILNFQILLRLTLDNKEILNTFTNKIVSILDKKLKFVILSRTPFDNETKSIDLEIDINATPENVNNANLFNYLTVSEQLKDAGNRTQNQNVQSSQSTISTITINNTFQACEGSSPENRELYIPVNSAQNTQSAKKWIRKDFDSKYIDFYFGLGVKEGSSFFNKYKIFPEQSYTLLHPENLEISGELVKRKSESIFYTEEEFNKNSFYKVPPNIIKLATEQKRNININSSFQKNSKNFVTYEAIKYRLKIMSDFLIQLKELIASNENVDPENVLIIPINVIRFKSGQDGNESRHLYGLAVDFTVYINFSNSIGAEASVFQIPPEIVYLYCLKRVELFTNTVPENCGYGIFIDEAYNHFEYLGFVNGEQTPIEINKGLSEDEKANGRLWIVGGQKNELVDSLKDKNINQRKEGIKEYVRKNYLDTKFTRLIQ